MSTSVNLEVHLTSKRLGERPSSRLFWRRKSNRVSPEDPIRSEDTQLIHQPFSLSARAACKDKSWLWSFNSLSPTEILSLPTET